MICGGVMRGYWFDGESDECSIGRPAKKESACGLMLLVRKNAHLPYRKCAQDVSRHSPWHRKCSCNLQTTPHMQHFRQEQLDSSLERDRDRDVQQARPNNLPPWWCSLALPSTLHSPPSGRQASCTLRLVIDNQAWYRSVEQ